MRRTPGRCRSLASPGRSRGRTLHGARWCRGAAGVDSLRYVSPSCPRHRALAIALRRLLVRFEGWPVGRRTADREITWTGLCGGYRPWGANSARDVVLSSRASVRVGHTARSARQRPLAAAGRLASAPGRLSGFDPQFWRGHGNAIIPPPEAPPCDRSCVEVDPDRRQDHREKLWRPRQCPYMTYMTLQASFVTTESNSLSGAS
jgi:hypothetical protein